MIPIDNEGDYDYFTSTLYFSDYSDFSTTGYMTNPYNKRKVVQACLSECLAGTYFDWLPLELIEMIFEWERHRERTANHNYFYNYYFTQEETNYYHVRLQRPSKAELAKLGDPNGLRQPDTAGFTRVNVDATDPSSQKIWVRKIFPSGTGGDCYRAFLDLFASFNDDKVKGVDTMYKLYTKYLLWIVDHSYIPKWYSMFMSMLRKVYITYDDMEEIINHNPTFGCFGDLETATKVMEKIKSMKFIIENYLPYMILTRSDEYYKAIHDNEAIPDTFVDDVLYTIYSITHVHPNDIDMWGAYEFEMALHAPDYYLNVYKQYMTLRNGKIVIPPGKVPMFYWCAGKFVHRFV
jgi:hypothetical protein